MGGKGSGRGFKVNWKDPAIQKLACQVYSLGMSLAEVCTLCGASRDSIENYWKKDPKFRAALDEAKAKRKLHALNSAYSRAFPATLDKKHDSPMAQFLLRTQFGLREPPQQIQVDSANSSNPKPVGWDDQSEERLRYLEEKERKLKALE